MRIALILIGFILSAPSAYALQAPDPPFTLSAYVQDVFAHMDGFLSAATGNVQPCNDVVSEAKAARRLRTFLFDIENTDVVSQRSITHSACLANDVRAMELYMRLLIDKMLEKAAQCDGGAVQDYFTGVEYVWGRLRALRQFGLDPEVEVPAGDSSSRLCPYDSIYAAPGYGDVGCQGIVASTIIDPVLEQEVTLLEQIIDHLDNTVNIEFPGFRNGLTKIWGDAAQFVSSPRCIQPYLYANLSD